MPRPPARLGNFIGQKDIVASARRLIAGCLNGRVPRTFPNVLLTGPSGIGKSHFAQAGLAKVYGTHLRYVLAGRELSRADICLQLSRLEHCDFLFLDECHSLKKEVQEVLYLACDKGETFEVDFPKGKPHLTGQTVQVNPFTLIVATDRPGDLRQALIRRLPVTYALLSYSDSELREITSIMAADMGVCLSRQACTVIAKASRGTPRSIRFLLQRLAIYHPKHTEEALGKRDVLEMLRLEGVHPQLGLTSTDRAYLMVLAERGNKPTSLASIAVAIGHDSDYVEREVEGYLVRKGLVDVGKSGRVLTDKGMGFTKKGSR